MDVSNHIVICMTYKATSKSVTGSRGMGTDVLVRLSVPITTASAMWSFGINEQP